ncbi:MAG: hypothetical protein IPJ33_11740 [Gammaproteobacteria bacterium]|jgi:Spy/CpxP family protein refolding chaperone|nr:hypothetical protein [Gammaproteobacteria bacterium]MBP6052869.1 hypothetical protein [Pseudomonadales bacterium]MBK6582374.1 hypothetical protein [Gammaproteobacteria bacterium]MBK7171483.1 hypothetical protein [Gammaproteobacteria bacterium]MBK7521354.1 hypothetical protein [Gammaproteobacteria bacterium]
MKLITGLLVCALAFAFNTASAEDAPTALAEHNLQMLGNKIRVDKKMLVAGNMKLTDTEAAGFWPLYDVYQQELNLLNKRTLAVIKTYAGQYDAGALDDATAEKLVREMIAIDEDTLKLNKSYLPKLLKVMPGMKVVRYMQIEHKIRAVVDYELSDAVPLVP